MRVGRAMRVRKAEHLVNWVIVLNVMICDSDSYSAWEPSGQKRHRYPRQAG